MLVIPILKVYFHRCKRENIPCRRQISLLAWSVTKTQSLPWFEWISLECRRLNNEDDKDNGWKPALTTTHWRVQCSLCLVCQWQLISMIQWERHMCDKCGIDLWFITNLSILSMSFFFGRRAEEGKSTETAEDSLSSTVQWFKKKVACSVTQAGAVSYSTAHKPCCMSFLLSAFHLVPLLYMRCETGISSKSW